MLVVRTKSSWEETVLYSYNPQLGEAAAGFLKGQTLAGSGAGAQAGGWRGFFLGGVAGQCSLALPFALLGTCALAPLASRLQ